MGFNLYSFDPNYDQFTERVPVCQRFSLPNSGTTSRNSYLLLPHPPTGMA